MTAQFSPILRRITPERRRRRHRWVPVLSVIALLAVLVLVGLGGGAWYFSQQILGVTHNSPDYSIQARLTLGDRIVLQRTADTARPGVYGLQWPGGHAIVEGIIHISSETVLRHVAGDVQGLSFRQATPAHLNASVYTTPADVHLRYRTIPVPDTLGTMPAWYIPGRRHTWAILVHGYKNSRSEGIRPMPVLSSMGLPVLDISYRNDLGAAASPDGLYHLGATEWQDVEAGVRYALAHGAQRVILYGYSMGGGTVETFLHRSTLAANVQAVVLDAPALDWGSVLDLAATQRGVPAILADVTKRVVAFRLGLGSLDDINGVRSARGLHTRTLLFHGTRDTTVPIAGSDALARARPDLITYDRVPRAEHTEGWNIDHHAYERVLAGFLRRVLRG